MTGYIYVMWDKDENDIFYVGSTINPRQRMKQHNFRVTVPRSSMPIKAATFYGHSIIEEVDFEYREELLKIEIYWIHQFSAWGYNIKNKLKYKHFDFSSKIVYLDIEWDLYNFILEEAENLSEQTGRAWGVERTIVKLIKDMQKIDNSLSAAI